MLSRGNLSEVPLVSGPEGLTSTSYEVLHTSWTHAK